MGLKAELEDKSALEALPEPVRKLYVEKNGKLVLDVEGVVPASELATVKSKLDEFRTNNKTLFNENTTLKQRFEGIDPDEVRILREQQDKLKASGIKDVSELAASVKSQVEAQIKPIREKLEASEAARLKAEQEATQVRFRTAIRERADRYGVRAASVRHVIRDAEERFKLEGAELVPVEEGSDVTVDKWFQDLAKNEPNLFEPSKGGGADHRGAAHGAKMLINPSPEEMGKHVDDIASGKVVVVRK